MHEYDISQQTLFVIQWGKTFLTCDFYLTFFITCTSLFPLQG